MTVPSPRCHWGEEGRERVFGQETEPGRKRGCWQRSKPQRSAEAPREVPCRAREHIVVAPLLWVPQQMGQTLPPRAVAVPVDQTSVL